MTGLESKCTVLSRLIPRCNKCGKTLTKMWAEGGVPKWFWIPSIPLLGLFFAANFTPEPVRTVIVAVSLFGGLAVAFATERPLERAALLHFESCPPSAKAAPRIAACLLIGMSGIAVLIAMVAFASRSPLGPGEFEQSVLLLVFWLAMIAVLGWQTYRMWLSVKGPTGNL